MTQYILYALCLVIGIVIGLRIAVAVDVKRVQLGTAILKKSDGWHGSQKALNEIALKQLQAKDVIYQDGDGEWHGSEEALADLTNELLYPDEHLLEWPSEDDRPCEV
jgi:hypothetical protein